MADDSTPAWFLPQAQIAQTPFLQSYNGIAPPFANTMDQIQQSMQISGVYPGQMPDNTFLGNTAARYAFGRQLPGTSPYQGALTSYMQGKGMPTGVNLGLLGLQNGIGQPPPPSGGPPYSTGGSYSQSGPPYGGGYPTGGGIPPPGNPAPPPGGVPPPSGGGGGGGTPPPSGGLLGGGGGLTDYISRLHSGTTISPTQQRAYQTAAIAGMPTDTAGKVMYSIVNRLPWNSTGLSSDQFNQAYYALPSDWNRAAYKYHG